MCGIVAYIGHKEAAPILLEGLKRLEYRGYDSAGLAIMRDGALHLAKAVGRVSVLEELVNRSGTFGGTITSTLVTPAVQIVSAAFFVIFWPASTMISPARSDFAG